MLENLKALKESFVDYVAENSGPLKVGVVIGGATMFLIWVFVAVIA